MNWQMGFAILKGLSGGSRVLLIEVKEARFWKANGDETILRGVVKKTVYWLDTTRAVDGVAVQLDPAKASLAWVDVRFLLRASTTCLCDGSSHR